MYWSASFVARPTHDFADASLDSADASLDFADARSVCASRAFANALSASACARSKVHGPCSCTGSQP
ncbi:hypothetical protein ROS62_02465 [Streptomyces sp. DSM 41972]|uniref:Uncharacterized protein n=1 Tax=Streptomyces althioticus subsp. attaecolombicae TaxID=3075534 RepID=A0ABU3HT04_9ACTN|nr:hypothetical protein [Streptomyces sp. DSM 41972]SCD40207.1 hypothetical protein GA0115238_107239 [Streptomyces sp. di50b]SCE47139.1 hypothetical protein GA0115245_143613 [Streptomyces sp. di188]